MKTNQTNLIAEHIDRAKRSIQSSRESIVLLRRTAQLLKGIDLADCSYCYVIGNIDRSFRIYLTLQEERKDSKLPHKIAQKLGVKFEKHQDTEQSLAYVAEFEQDGVSIYLRIEGAVPSTCKLVETETPLTDEEYEEELQKAIASVKKVRVTTKIQCE